MKIRFFFVLAACFLTHISQAQAAGSSVGRILKVDVNAGTDTMNIYLDPSAAEHPCPVGRGNAFGKMFTTQTAPGTTAGPGLKNVHAAILMAKASGKRIEVWYDACVNDAYPTITTIKLID